MSEVNQHDHPASCWVVIDGEVWDVTNWLEDHPGGAKIILNNAGKDVTALFKPIHPPNVLERNLKPENKIGQLDPSTKTDSSKQWEEEQARIKAAREALAPVQTMLSLQELEKAAETILSAKAAMYYANGADDQRTLHENANNFKKCRFVPRVMVDVGKVAPQTKLFGLNSPLPIYISPSSNALLGHPDGELTLVRGASATGVVQGISAASALPLDEILQEKYRLDEETKQPMSMIYQVYVQKDRDRTEKAVREAVEGGCKWVWQGGANPAAKSLTGPVLLPIEHCCSRSTLPYWNDKLKGFNGDVSPGRRMDPWEEFPAYHDPRLNWDDLKWFKSLSKGLPIYLKGVASAEDIKIAKEHGLAGVILSNHGGRQLDTARTAFDSLRQIHKEDPQLLKEMEVYVDGGFRRGTDVLMALCLGAKGVGFGRSFLWAQSAYGEEGVIRAVRILEKEIITGMRLLGADSISDLKPEMLECLQENWGRA